MTTRKDEHDQLSSLESFPTSSKINEGETTEGKVLAVRWGSQNAQTENPPKN